MKFTRKLGIVILGMVSLFCLATALSVPYVRDRSAEAQPAGNPYYGFDETLESGTYYLDRDVEISSAIQILGKADVIFDLNGHTLTMTGDDCLFYLNGDGTYNWVTLTLKDSSENNSGKLTGGKGSYKHSTARSAGGAVIVNANADFIMEGGTITGNETNLNRTDVNLASGGGGVYLNGQNCTFTMNGGIISGNKTNGNGGGVFVANGAKFTMNGGEICGNKAAGNKAAIPGGLSNSFGGGGIYTYTGGTVELKGGAVYDNEVGYPAVGGGIYVAKPIEGNDSYRPLIVSGEVNVTGNRSVGKSVSGDSTVDFDNVHLFNGAGGKVSVGSGGLKGRSHIGISLNDCGTDFASYSFATSSESGFFLSDEPDFLIKQESGGISVAKRSEDEFVCKHNGNPSNDLAAALESGGVVEMNDSGYIQSTIKVTDELTIILHNDEIIMAGAKGGVFEVASNSLSSGTLTLDVGNNGTTGYLTGGNAEMGGGVFVADGGTLIINAGGIQACSATDGGGVYVADGGTFRMNGGTLASNKATNGGGVYVADGGSFTSTRGGDISTSISRNKATNGGGVYVADGGTFTFGYTAIEYNTASGQGGGVCLNGTMEMTALGRINYNSATSGGGIYMGNSSVLTAGGGSINGNTASDKGGGLYFGGSVLKIDGNGTEVLFNTVAELANNTYLPAGQKITFGTKGSYPSDMGITGSEAPSDQPVVFTSGYSAYGIGEFISDDPRYCIRNESGEMCLTLHDTYKISGTPATCTQDGKKDSWGCRDCTLIFSDESATTVVSGGQLTIPKTGHDLAYVSEQSATCTQKGSMAHWHCGNCGKNFEDEDGSSELSTVEIDLLPHTFDEWIVDTRASCTKEGAKHRICTFCSAEQKESIPLLPHTYGDWIEEVPATPEKEGVKGHKDCSVCEKHFDSDGTELSDADLVIPILEGSVAKLEADGEISYYESIEAAWKAAKDSYNNNAVITLLADVCPTGKLSVGNWQVTLNLNGKTLNRGGSGAVFDITSQGTLIVQDTVGGGTITGGKNSSSNFFQGNIYVTNGSTFCLEGGTITGNTAYSGGGVYVAAGGSFIMSGGAITGNTIQKEAYYGHGAGVYAEEGAILKFSGKVTISGNTNASDKDEKNHFTENLYLAGTSDTVIVEGALTGSAIGVTREKAGKLTAGYAACNPDGTGTEFIGDSSRYSVAFEGGEVSLFRNYTVTFYNVRTVLYKTSVLPGGEAVYKGETPVREADSSYSYTFNGKWMTSNGGSTEASLKNVQNDMSVYAGWTMKPTVAKFTTDYSKYTYFGSLKDAVDFFNENTNSGQVGTLTLLAALSGNDLLLTGHGFFDLNQKILTLDGSLEVAAGASVCLLGGRLELGGFLVNNGETVLRGSLTVTSTQDHVVKNGTSAADALLHPDGAILTPAGENAYEILAGMGKIEPGVEVFGEQSYRIWLVEIPAPGTVIVTLKNSKLCDSFKLVNAQPGYGLIQKGSTLVYAYTHEHVWEYAADGNVLTAKCVADGCDASDGGRLTLTAEGGIYSGNAYAAQVSDELRTDDSFVIVYTDINNQSVNAAIGAGSYIASVTLGGATANATFVISPKEVTVSGIVAKNKTYDGGTNAEFDCSGALFGGLIEGDELTVSANGTFTQKNAGIGIAVTLAGLILGGEDAGNYVLAANGQQTSSSADIARRSVTVTISAGGGVFGGSIVAASATLNGAVVGETVAVMLGYSGTANDGTSCPSAGLPERAGSYTVTASVNDPNYVLTGTLTAEFVVSQQSLKLPVLAAKEYTGGTLTAEVPASDLYSVGENNGGTNAGEYDVLLELTDFHNYCWVGSDEAVAVAKFRIEPADNEIENISLVDWIYGQIPGIPTATALFGEVTFTYSDNENGGFTDQVPADAGNWYVRASVAATKNYTGAEKVIGFVIAKAQVALPAADPTDYTYDGTEKIYRIADSTRYTVENATRTDATGDQPQKVTVSLTDKKNYEWATGSTEDLIFDFAIERAQVTVSVGDQRSAQGKSVALSQSDWELTAGKVYGKDVLGIALSTEADKDKAGFYSINVSGWTNPNYTVRFEPGEYEVYSVAGYTAFVSEFGETMTLAPETLSWANAVEIGEMMVAYGDLSADDLGELTQLQKDAIAALGAKAEDISKAKVGAEALIGNLAGVTAADIRAESALAGVLEDIRAAKAGAEDYAALSFGGLDAAGDLTGYELIAAAERAVEIYREYAAFADAYSDEYAKDPADLTFGETDNIFEVFAAYEELSEAAAGVLTAEERATIAALKTKADLLSEGKAEAERALGEIDRAVGANADKAELYALLARAEELIGVFVEENGRREEVQNLAALDAAERAIADQEKSEVETEVSDNLGELTDWTTDKISGTDIPVLEEKIDAIGEVFDLIAGGNELSQEELGALKGQLAELKEKLENELALENSKLQKVSQLLEEKEKHLASGTFTKAAAEEIGKRYDEAVATMMGARTPDALNAAQTAGIGQILAVERLHVGWLVVDLLLALIVIGETAYLILKSRDRRIKTRSIALPLLAAGAGAVTGAMAFGILLAAAGLLGFFVVRSVLTERRQVKGPETGSIDDVSELVPSPDGDITEESGENASSDAQTFDRESSAGAGEASLPEGSENEETAVRKVDRRAGIAIVVRYSRSFSAKLIQSEQELKARYSMLKNELLAFRRVNERMSWNYESFNVGRTHLAKFVIRGKTLFLYLALSEKIAARFGMEHSESKKFGQTPYFCRIKSDRRAKTAAELIAALGEAHGLTGRAYSPVDHTVPYERTEALVARGLIKELVTEENYAEYLRRRSLAELDRSRREFVSAAEVNGILGDEVAAALVERRETQTEAREERSESLKKAIVNIDTLCRVFSAGDTVDLAALKEAGLIPKGTDCVKILAKGTLDRPLTVEAHDFSREAIKMILLTGGRVRKV